MTEEKPVGLLSLLLNFSMAALLFWMVAGQVILTSSDVDCRLYALENGLQSRIPERTPYERFISLRECEVALDGEWAPIVEYKKELKNAR